MKMIRYLLITTLLVVCFSACGDKPSVQVTVAQVQPTGATFAITRLTANLLNRKPADDMDRPDALMMINQGDQIVPIQESGNWTQVQHVVSGNIGWLHKSFVQMEQRSKWWSADTDRARTCAEDVYKDKIFMQNNWPVAHISIEERWNKMVITILEDREFAREEAVECAEFTLGKLNERFPDWKDRQVFINGTWEGQPYTLVMTDDKKPTFL